MGNLIVVGMADLNVGGPGTSIVTYGLGSCVGVTLYDPQIKLAGMAHVMLPDSKAYSGPINKAKFMDTALMELLTRMSTSGAVKSRLVAKMAGGAHMFDLSKESDIIKVGQRNGERGVYLLGHLGIPIKAKELGGRFGRTITIDADTGQLHIRTVGQGEKIV